MALSRLLDDFRAALRDEIAQTTEDSEGLQDEFRYLAREFGGTNERVPTNADKRYDFVSLELRELI